jgi:uncharacterized GH25 family protein
MRHSVRTLLVAGGLLLHSTVHAHGLWIEERRGNIEVIYGHGAEDDAYGPDKVRQAWAFDVGGKPLASSITKWSDHARVKPDSAPASVMVVLDNGVWTQKPDRQWVNLPKQQVPGALQASQSLKYSLAIYQPRAKLAVPEAAKFVILPQGDALQVGPGKPLTVQVLLDGKPAAGIEVIGDYRNAPHTVSAKTDAQGHATLTVRNEGLNVIAAQTKQAVSNDPDLDRLSYFASLTFLGEPHHE